MAVVLEAVAVGDLSFDAPDRQVHAGHAPGGVVGLLAVNGDIRRRPAAVAVAAGVGLDELDGLDEHAGGAAAGVVDPALVRLQHLYQQPHHAARRVELAALAAFGQGKLLQEVFVDAAQHVRGARLGPAQLDVADHVDHLPQASLVQRGPGVVLGQHAVERRVVPLDGGHGVVDGRPNGGLVRLTLQYRPARLGRHPEDALGAVFVRVFGVRAVDDLLLQLRVGFLERVGDVLEEDQAKDDVLVLGGVHAAAQGVGHAPHTRI